MMEIPISHIFSDTPLPHDPKSFLFAVFLLQKKPFPPISVEKLADGTYKLISGRYRVSAYQLLGREKIMANIAIPEDPNPFSDLKFNGKNGHHPVPQADGYSLNERGTSYE